MGPRTRHPVGARKRRETRPFRQVAVNRPRAPPTPHRCGSVSPANAQKKGEPTSGLEPLTCSLRPRQRALLTVAQGCKPCTYRAVTFLGLAECCTVLRSRWCQYCAAVRVTCSPFLGRFSGSGMPGQDDLIPGMTRHPSALQEYRRKAVLGRPDRRPLIVEVICRRFLGHASSGTIIGVGKHLE